MVPGVGPTKVKSGKIPLGERIKISHKGAIAVPIGEMPAKRAKPEPAAAAAPAPIAGRKWTATVAVPASMLQHAQTPELRSHLVGQVARACSLFSVDEIVIYSTDDDGPPPPTIGRDKPPPNLAVFMARVLQYIECPSYLRKHIFPHHPDLRNVGTLPPLDAPHHVRLAEESEFREAVVVAPGEGGQAGNAADADAAAAATAASDQSASVHAGLRKEMRIGRELPIGTRVTLRMPKEGANKRLGSMVAPRVPREEAGLYWGYSVRVARGLAAVWSECPHAAGYDLAIGASEQGAPVHGAAEQGRPLPRFEHLLVVFEGAEGIGAAVAADETLDEFAEDLGSLFDRFLDLGPPRASRGCRTVRTEEALFVGLGALKPMVDAAQP